MHTLPLDPTRFGTLLTHGAKLVASRQTWPASTLAPQLKHRSRLPWWLAEQAARAAGALPLFVNEQNQWTETPTANFLLVRGGVVYSPPRTQILHGVSLDVVEELCADLGIAFRERPLPIDEPGDEALLTNTSYCVAGVAELAGRRLEWPGPIYTRLRAGWPAG
jgi:branched-subunit amino acid aminotransferase/4-amino-4-deoxychorismate lyase